MASNMTKAFQAKAKRALGCRPGYAEGGGVLSPDYGVGASQSSVENMLSRVPALGGVASTTASYSNPDMISKGPLKTDGAIPTTAYNDDPRGRAALDRDRMVQNGMSEGSYQQFYSPDAQRRQRMEEDAAGKVREKLGTLTMSEQAMLNGHDPHAMYSYQGGNKVYQNENPEVSAKMRAQGLESIGLSKDQYAPGAISQGYNPEMRAALRGQIGTQLSAKGYSNLWGYADGGKVDPPTRAPRDDYEVPKTFMGHVQKIGGLVGRMVDEIRNPVQSAPDQSSPLDVREQIVKRHVENAQARDAYADGGAVRQVEFQGPGGPREDKIPVRFAGADIRVSDGERGLILPAKTAANPQAVDAIEDIIQGTNDGRSPRRGLGDGGRYADGLDPRTAAGAYDAGKWSPEATRFRAERGFVVEPAIGAQPAPAAPTQPQNIAPELAPVAEPQVRRGLLGRGVDALKGGAQNVAGKVLGMEPKVQTAEAATPAPTAKPVEKSPTPITDRAQALGKALGKGEIPGVMKTDTQGNKYLTKGAGAAAGIGTALQAGDHWDAYGDRPGGLTHGERAQLFARDMGVLAGGTAGAVGGGVAGSFVTPIVGTGVGGVAGAVIGGTLADKGMGKLRESANWVNEKLGGAPNYFEDSDAMIARDRAAREAQGIPESAPQRTARAVNSTIGSALQGAINFIGGSSAGGSSWGGEGRTPTLVDQGATESPSGGAQAQAAPAPEPNRGGRAQVSGIDNAMAALTPEDVQRQRTLGANTGNAGKVSVEKDGNMIGFHSDIGRDVVHEKFAPGTGMATVTGAAANGGRMMPGVKRNKLGTSIAIGPGKYTAKDGSDTSDWYKTQAYEDAMRRNAQNRVDLSQIQNERAGRDPMMSRALGQQMMPPGEDAATDTSSRDALLQSAMKNLASSNPGTRALGQQHMAAYDHLAKQALALSKAQWERGKDVTEMGAKGNELAMKQEESFRKSVEADPLFQKTVDGKQSVDTEKAGQYVNLLNSTMRHAHDEAPDDQKALFFNSVTKKARGAGELDPVQREILRNRFDIMGRVMSKAGGWPWNGPNQTSDDLRDWEPTDIGDGKVEFKRLTKKFGKSVVIPKSYLEYEGGALNPFSPSRLFATQTSQYLPTEQGAK